MHSLRLLTRTFFSRLFESDLMPAGLPQVQLVIWSMMLLATPGLLLPSRFIYKYWDIHEFPTLLEHAFLIDRLIFIVLTMTALGLVALVIWEGVFPDRRDARILGVLPIRGRLLIIARFFALTMVAGIFSLGVNAVPTFTYGPQVGRYGIASNMVTGAFAHFVSTTLAGAFVFFTLISLQAVLLNLMGRRAVERWTMALYSYAVPEPNGLKTARIRPAQAFYSVEMGEFILPYDDVRTSDAPEKVVMDFLQSTYEAAANLAGWNRGELERPAAPETQRPPRV